jgi:selenium metabolism protein YedF
MPGTGKESREVYLKQNKATLVLSHDKMGHGDDALGAVLIKKFLKTYLDIVAAPDFILLFNSGVKLAAEGSEVLGELKALELRGATVLSCGTCVEHFKLGDKLRAGRISNMHEIVSAMTAAERVVQI